MLATAEGQYARQVQIASTTAAATRKLWGQLGTSRFSRVKAKLGFTSDWTAIVPELVALVEAGRAAAVVTALPYTAATLAEQGFPAPRVAELDGSRFMASAPSGAPVAQVLEAPVARTRRLIGEGISVQSALERGGAFLTGIVLTMMADTRRSVYGVDIASRPKVGGYIRMLQAPSCSRCVILAGKFFRWNDGFLRHPRCDCLHAAVAGKKAAEDAGLISDPYDYFKSLSESDQNRLFGKSNAKAIRDGADIYRVQNVRQRGLSTAIGRGQKTRRYATMTPDDIYAMKLPRDESIRLLTEQGYLKPYGQVTRQATEIYSAPISRPIVAGSNRDRVLAARRTGVRDPLDRATMTTSERDLYDSWYRYRYSETFASAPTSIGANAITRYELPRGLQTGRLDELRETFETQWIAALEQGDSQSLFDLAELLEARESLPTRVLDDRLNWRP